MSRNNEAWPPELLIDRLPLSVRASNALKAIGIKTVGDLDSLSDSDLLRHNNFGRKSLNELRAVLAEGRPALRADDTKDLQKQIDDALRECAMWRGKYEGAIEAIRTVGLRLKDRQ